jgi:hypothetical protein
MSFVFYDFETTQDTKFSENAIEHIPILMFNKFAPPVKYKTWNDLKRLETT